MPSGCASKRIRRGDDDVRRAYVAERYTLRLRTMWYPFTETAYVIPVVAALLVGGLLANSGHASLAQVTAVTLYFQQLVDPVDRLLGWLDELQVGASSLARLVGVGRVPADRVATGRSPTANNFARTACASRTARVATCCTASTSMCGPASASRWSVRAAPARARWVGCSPASTAPARAA